MCVTDPVRYCSHAVRAFIREMFGFTLETSAIGCFLPSHTPAVRKTHHGRVVTSHAFCEVCSSAPRRFSAREI